MDCIFNYGLSCGRSNLHECTAIPNSYYKQTSKPIKMIIILRWNIIVNKLKCYTKNMQYTSCSNWNIWKKNSFEKQAKRYYLLLGPSTDFLKYQSEAFLETNHRDNHAMHLFQMSTPYISQNLWNREIFIIVHRLPI